MVLAGDVGYLVRVDAFFLVVRFFVAGSALAADDNTVDASTDKFETFSVLAKPMLTMGTTAAGRRSFSFEPTIVAPKPNSIVIIQRPSRIFFSLRSARITSSYEKLNFCSSLVMRVL